WLNLGLIELVSVEARFPHSRWSRGGVGWFVLGAQSARAADAGERGGSMPVLGCEDAASTTRALRRSRGRRSAAVRTRAPPRERTTAVPATGSASSMAR